MGFMTSFRDEERTNELYRKFNRTEQKLDQMVQMVEDYHLYKSTKH